MTLELKPLSYLTSLYIFDMFLHLEVSPAVDSSQQLCLVDTINEDP